MEYLWSNSIIFLHEIVYIYMIYPSQGRQNHFFLKKDKIKLRACSVGTIKYEHYMGHISTYQKQANSKEKKCMIVR